MVMHEGVMMVMDQGVMVPWNSVNSNVSSAGINNISSAGNSITPNASSAGGLGGMGNMSSIGNQSSVGSSVNHGNTSTTIMGGTMPINVTNVDGAAAGGAPNPTATNNVSGSAPLSPNPAGRATFFGQPIPENAARKSVDISGLNVGADGQGIPAGRASVNPVGLPPPIPNSVVHSAAPTPTVLSSRGSQLGQQALQESRSRFAQQANQSLGSDGQSTIGMGNASSVGSLGGSNMSNMNSLVSPIAAITANLSRHFTESPLFGDNTNNNANTNNTNNNTHNTTGNSNANATNSQPLGTPGGGNSRLATPTSRSMGSGNGSGGKKKKMKRVSSKVEGIRLNPAETAGDGGNGENNIGDDSDANANASGKKKRTRSTNSISRKSVNKSVPTSNAARKTTPALFSPGNNNNNIRSVSNSVVLPSDIASFNQRFSTSGQTNDFWTSKSFPDPVIDSNIGINAAVKPTNDPAITSSDKPISPTESTGDHIPLENPGNSKISLGESNTTSAASALTASNAGTNTGNTGTNAAAAVDANNYTPNPISGGIAAGKISMARASSGSRRRSRSNSFFANVNTNAPTANIVNTNAPTAPAAGAASVGMPVGMSTNMGTSGSHQPDGSVSTTNKKAGAPKSFGAIAAQKLREKAAKQQDEEGSKWW